MTMFTVNRVTPCLGLSSTINYNLMTRSCINFSSAFSVQTVFSIIHGFGLAFRLPLTVLTKSGNYKGLFFGLIQVYCIMYVRSRRRWLEAPPSPGALSLPPLPFPFVKKNQNVFICQNTVHFT
jgi:hypothetical protein